nr:unnamed protein product [Digitaria exilis]
MEQERPPPATKRARPSPPRAQDAAAASAEDRLSALDDTILHAILVRLPLRDAAATTALSRRWPRVFATLPRLLLHPATFNRRGFPDEGCDDFCEDTARWIDALDSVLDGRAAPVAALEVHARFLFQFRDWFRGAFRELCGSGGLLELSIDNTKHSESERYELPTPIYGCTTLTSLDLYNCRLRVPGKLTGLRAVRSLRLRNVLATDADARRLISRCSASEHLEIQDIHRVRNIVIRSPCLEKLDICSYRPLCISVKKAPRLDTVELSLFYFHGWIFRDTMYSDEDYSLSEIKEMAEREKQVDEIGNLVTFLGGLGCTKKLTLKMCTEYSKVLSKAKGAAAHHDHWKSPVPLAAEFWEERINGDCVLNHLSSITIYIDSLLESYPCLGLCQFLVMNARILKRMSIHYYRWQLKMEQVAMVEAVRNELQLWPRANPNVLLELSPVDRHPSY